MAAITLPEVQDLPSCSQEAQIQTLDSLFEPSPAIHHLLLPLLNGTKHSSYESLIDACHAKLQTLTSSPAAEPDPALLSVVGSHPRLGAKKVDSAQSAAEQANLQGQGEELATLNAEYEEKFPGLRYVVFVNGRGRPEIMENMRSRIARGDFDSEVKQALQVSSESQRVGRGTKRC